MVQRVRLPRPFHRIIILVQKILKRLLHSNCQASISTKWTDSSLVVDAHVAVLIHRLLDINKFEIFPSELLWWAITIFRTPIWQQITKGKDTMGWNGKESWEDKTTISDTQEVSKPDVKGKGRIE